MQQAFLIAHAPGLLRRGLTARGIADMLAAQGIELCGEIWTEKVDKGLREQILAAGARSLIVAGGDGTLHQIVNLAVPLGLPLGILPLGTANDFARSLGIPATLPEAIAVLASAQMAAVDLGELNGHLFINAAHLGLGVETVKLIKPGLKRLMGSVAYMVAAFQALKSMDPIAIECELPNQGLVKLYAYQVLIGNGRQFGGGMTISELASFGDGLLDVYLLESRIGPAGMLRLASSVWGKGSRHPGLIYFRASRFSAQLWKPAPVNMDGELFPAEDRLDFRVRPACLQVCVPAGFAHIGS